MIEPEGFYPASQLLKSVCLYWAEWASTVAEQINPAALDDEKWDDIMDVVYFEHIDTDAVWKNMLGKGLRDR